MDDRRKNYRAWDPEQSCREPVSPRDALPEDDLIFFLLDVIGNKDFATFSVAAYGSELGGCAILKPLP